MFDHVQVIEDKKKSLFAMIPYEEFLVLRDLLTDPAKLSAYLDYLNARSAKGESIDRLTLAEVKAALKLTSG